MASAAIVAATIWIVGVYGAIIIAATNGPKITAAKQANPSAAKALVPPKPAPSVSKVDPLIAICTTGINDIVAKANGFMRTGEIEQAYGTLSDCRQYMVDAKALALFKKATIESTKLTEKRNEKAARALKAEKKKTGVAIGMSRQDALDSSWGRPRSINRSTFSFGVHEQWVYDGGYLYFENGVLTSIQN